MGQTLKCWLAQSTDGRPRWREQKNIYNQRDLTKRGGGGRQFERHQEVLLVKYQKRRRRIHPRTRPEDGPWPSPQQRCWRSCSPMILPDRWRSPHKGPVLKPASLPNSLYWAYWVWIHSHLQWKTPSKLGPYNHNSNFPNITTTLNSKYMKKIFWILKYIVYFRHYTMKYFINHKISIVFNWESKVWSICLFPKH